jgi:hypothetical protein
MNQSVFWHRRRSSRFSSCAITVPYEPCCEQGYWKNPEPGNFPHGSSYIVARRSCYSVLLESKNQEPAQAGLRCSSQASAYDCSPACGNLPVHPSINWSSLSRTGINGRQRGVNCKYSDEKSYRDTNHGSIILSSRVCTKVSFAAPLRPRMFLFPLLCQMFRRKDLRGSYQRLNICQIGIGIMLRAAG